MIDYAQVVFKSITTYEWIAFAAGIILISFCDKIYNAVMRLRKKENRFHVSFCLKLLLVYVLFILFVTVFSRLSSHQHEYEFVLFWSWHEVIYNKRIELLDQIVLNILLFVPLGMMLKMNFKKYSLFKICLLGLTISVAVEMSQLVFHLGLFEWDDMIHNSIGCLIGGMIMKILYQIHYYSKMKHNKL